MQNKLDSRGVTLVEVMISLVILLIVFMGLIQASLLSINHNLRNEIRDEAVRVAAEYMSRTRSDSFGNLVGTGGYVTFPGTPTAGITRNFRNLQLQFLVEREIDVVDINIRRIGIRVSWWYPGDDTTLPFQQKPQHTIFYSVRNPVQ